MTDPTPLPRTVVQEITAPGVTVVITTEGDDPVEHLVFQEGRGAEPALLTVTYGLGDGQAQTADLAAAVRSIDPAAVAAEIQAMNPDMGADPIALALEAVARLVDT